MGKTEKNTSIILEFFRGIENPACIVNREGELLEVNNSFDKLFKHSTINEPLKHISSVLSEKDNTRVITALYEEKQFTTLKVEGVVCNSCEDYSNLFDIKILPLGNNAESILLFNEVFSKRISYGLSETSFRHTLLGMLTTGVSHDINNKLSVILGLAALAARKTPADNELTKDLKGIQVAAFEAANLVQSLVKFSRAKEDEKTLVNLSVVLKEIAKFARSVTPSTINILVDLDTDCGVVETRMGPLNSLFILIISEAIQSLNKGGELIVELGRSENKIICSLICNVEKIDNGALVFTGIRKNRLETIRSLASRAGVSIDMINNELGQTWGIRIIFDRKQQPNSSGMMGHESITDIALATGEKILLVEDEPMLARLLKRALEKSGYQVTIAENGRDGFDKWKSSGMGFDLILTDMTMPEMSGTELAKKVIEKQSDAKIILCTGFSDQVDEKEAKKIGIKRYLEKPVGNRDLLSAIRMCIDDN